VKHPSTQLIHLAEGASADARPLTTPIYETTTFLFDSAAELEAYQQGRSSQFIYSRYANPTVKSVEAKLAVLEHAERAVVFSSGMAATSTTLLALLAPGDELVVSSALYGGTMQLAMDLVRKFGVAIRTTTLDALREPDTVIGDRSRVLWCESPVNPTLRCLDVAAVAAACRARGVTSIMDNTFASPANQQPLRLGVDLVMHSATKYLNGHSDVTAGAIAGPEALVQRIAAARKQLGTVLDPAAAYALARGLKTLYVRMARHNANACAVARFLEGDPRVSRVCYPGLESHPDHAIAKRQMSGFGGMICFDLNGEYDRACRFFDRIAVFRRAASLGGVESLCSLPVLTSQYGYTDEQLAHAGVTRGMVRLSVGLEEPADLIADLDQALG
jgi:cystathionine beta-lyase/cystathionine gamma-synthase